MAGLPVLLIDMDPQGNASTGLGVERSERYDGTYRLLMSGKADGEHHPPNSGAEPVADRLRHRPRRLRGRTGQPAEARVPSENGAVRSAIFAGFRVILLDCPPGLGLLTLNALVAANGVVVPLQAEFFALEGISSLMHTIEAVRRRFNPGLRLAGILLTMFDRRNSLSGLVEKDARDHFGDWVFDVMIPRNVRVSEAPSHGKPVLTYDPKSSGAEAYMALADRTPQEGGHHEYAIGDHTANDDPRGDHPVSKPPPRLGRGLSVLLGDAAMRPNAEQGVSVIRTPVDQIDANPFQPRDGLRR